MSIMQRKVENEKKKKESLDEIKQNDIEQEITLKKEKKNVTDYVLTF